MDRITILSIVVCFTGFNLTYDLRIFSIANIYMREELTSLDRDASKSMNYLYALGTILGSIVGMFLSETTGRKQTIIISNMFQIFGPILVSSSMGLPMLLVGRAFSGIGLGTSFTSSLLYLSEWSTAKLRGKLISTIGIIFVFGQLVSFICVQVSSKVPSIWRFLFVIETVVPTFQLVLLPLCPESPRWLQREGSLDKAATAMREVYESEVAEQELLLIRNLPPKIPFTELVKTGFQNLEFRRALLVNLVVQITQHLVGSNIIAYITELNEDASKLGVLEQILLDILIPFMGATVTMFIIEKFGRRRSLVLSLTGVVISLFLLSATFNRGAELAPRIDYHDSKDFANATCPFYNMSKSSSKWTCMTCLVETCAFCSQINQFQPGACLVNEASVENLCRERHREWHVKSCPSKIKFLIILILLFYRLVHSLGTESIPFVLNVEIFPSQFLGLGVGVGALVSWIASLLVNGIFLYLIDILNWWGTILVYAILSLISLGYIFFFLPETRGCNLEDVHDLHAKAFMERFWGCIGLS